MTNDRRPYKREAQDVRREALIAAVLDLVAEGGPKAVTVRAIAARAGVTAGLIRHYFSTKEELVRESYRHMMDRMTADTTTVVDQMGDDPVQRLATFVAASLRPPVVDPSRLGLWAGFIHGVQSDPDMRKVHIQTYLSYRDNLQALIGQAPTRMDKACPKAAAIACNAVIDGLWMEASAAPELFESGEILEIGLRAVGSVLGLDLLSAYGPIALPQT